MKLLVIIASTRPGRIGAPIGEWFVGQARAHAGFEVEVADLAELNLPMYDEPTHPASGKYVHEHTKDWSARVGGAEAFVFVMPEYNHSFNGALKNAIDYLNHEWAHKPVGFVSYGGISGGMRAVAAIKGVASTLRMTPLVDAVTIPMARTMLDDAGFHPTDIVTDSAKTMLDELAQYSHALGTLRAMR